MRGQNGWGQGGCRYVTLFSTPTCTNKCTLCPRVTDGSVLATVPGELPILSHHPLYWGQLGGRHSIFSAFSAKQKSVGPLLHTRACVHVTPPRHPSSPKKKKKKSFQLQADHIPARLANGQQFWAWDTFLEGESLRESEKQGLVSAPPPLKSGLVN